LTAEVVADESDAVAEEEEEIWARIGGRFGEG
jgi:hypothetical protein